MPRAIVMTAVRAKAGLFRRDRRASRKSFQRVCIADSAGDETQTPRRGQRLQNRQQATRKALPAASCLSSIPPGRDFLGPAPQLDRAVAGDVADPEFRLVPSSERER